MVGHFPEPSVVMVEISSMIDVHDNDDDEDEDISLGKTA